MKWFITHNKFFTVINSIHILPEFCIWYDKEYFLETGVYTPAMGIKLCWLKWKYIFGIQKGY